MPRNETTPAALAAGSGARKAPGSGPIHENALARLGIDDDARTIVRKTQILLRSHVNDVHIVAAPHTRREDPSHGIPGFLRAEQVTQDDENTRAPRCPGNGQE